MQLFVLLVPLVADRLLDFLPLLYGGVGGDGDGRVTQLKVDLADPGTGRRYHKYIRELLPTLSSPSLRSR